jgi:hypothetical protein
MISKAEPAFNAMASAAGNEVKSNANWSKGIECITCLDVSYVGGKLPRLYRNRNRLQSKHSDVNSEIKAKNRG